VLSDNERKAKYDRGEQVFEDQGGTGGGGQHHFKSFFQQNFGGGGGSTTSISVMGRKDKN
jgi:DnaJ-class molecular chaperone